MERAGLDQITWVDMLVKRPRLLYTHLPLDDLDPDKTWPIHVHVITCGRRRPDHRMEAQVILMAAHIVIGDPDNKVAILVCCKVGVKPHTLDTTTPVTQSNKETKSSSGI